MHYIYSRIDEISHWDAMQCNKDYLMIIVICLVDFYIITNITFEYLNIWSYLGFGIRIFQIFIDFCHLIYYLRSCFPKGA